ncbi:sensor histidine kinase [Mesoterricola silvestris]|uniref:histidine kinase n=1 Tax=Mesoterricola silvestris TaxID=2927979 RepID=A0AA48GY63_9BACT|nr:sensor histidine kinase [Mesoterricola silvestris]BDU74041.1 histidine kinase [Mesoterricola silvestris]
MTHDLQAALLTFALALGVPGAAQPREAGTPFLRSFSPTEAGGSHPQNWAFAQGPGGLLYVGNGLGVLEYDGVKWRLLEAGGPVRALAWGPDGKLYVGGDGGETGCLEPDGTGGRYASFGRPQGPFTAVRGIHVLPQGTFFATREGLLLREGGRTTALLVPGGLWKSFAPGGKLYVQDQAGDLLAWSGSGLRPVPGTGALKACRIAFMVPLEGPEMLIGTRDDGLFRFDGRTLRPFATGVDAQLRAGQVYAGTRLVDGGIAVASVKAGAFLLEASGGLRFHLDHASGLRDDTVYQVFQDSQWGVWLGLNNGLARMEWPAVTSFGERDGLRSFPWAMARHKGVLYAATGQGIAYLDPAGPAPRFRDVPGIQGQCLALAEAGDDLLAVCSQRGILEVRGGRARVIAPGIRFPACILTSRVDPARVFIGSPEGIGSLRRRAGGWVEEGLVPGTREDIFAMAEPRPGVVWASSRSRGLMRAAFPAGGGAPALSRFGTAQGLPEEAYLRVSDVEGRLLVGTSRGVYVLDADGERFVPDRALGALFPEGPRAVEFLRPGPGGRIWMQTTDRERNIREAGAAVPDGRGGFRWEAGPFRTFAGADLAEIHPDADGVVWFSGPDGLFRHDPGVVTSPREGLRVCLRQVQGGDGGILAGTAPRVPYRNHSLRFTFALPSFDRESANRYQVRLEGLEEDWSPWTAVPFKEYTNLSEGSYRFRVRARDVYGRMVPEATFDFRVLPPWFRTWWAYAGFLGAAALALHLALRARTRYLRRQNQALSRTVEAHTAELVLRNQELHGLNALLSDLNEQKNQLFAIASHDLRNPLNSIVLSSELLEEEPDPAQVREISRRIRAEGMRMSDLLGRFLDYAAIEGGTVKAEPEPFPLAVLTAFAAARFGPIAGHKGIVLRVEPPADHEAFADLRFTKGILENLLSNAIKFSRPGTTVTLRAEADGPGALLTVQDQGPGFTPEDLEKVFRRFTPLSARPTGGEHSSGLGLSIVKHMADAMGARLELESRPGQGTSFRVFLPGPGGA